MRFEEKVSSTSSKPKVLEFNKMVFTPTYISTNMSIPTTSYFKYKAVPFESVCNKCNTPVLPSDTFAKKSEGYRLIRTCSTCKQELFSTVLDVITVANERAKWYIRWYWKCKLKLKEVFN